MAKGSKRKVSDRKDKEAEIRATPAKTAVFFRRPAVHVLIIVILGILIYANTFNVPFQFDDKYIVDNSNIKDFRHAIDPSLGNLSQLRFIGFASFALNYQLNALNVTGYHVFNLLIHLVNALFVYGVVFLTLRTSAASDNFQQDILKASPRYYWVPLFTALLFVSHPVQTQAVTYIVQRFASLATLFYLACLVMYIKSRNSGSRPARYSFYVVSLLAALLAMKTKEIAFTLPVMIILYEFLFFKGDMKKRVLYLAPFLLTMLIIPLTLMGSKGSAASFSAMDEITRSAGLEDVSRWDYLNTQFRVIVTYIRLLFIPINQNLDYDYPIYRTFFNPEVLLSFLFLLALFGLGVYLLYVSVGTRKGSRLWLRMVSFGIFWFFVTLSVESSFIPIADVIFEHRLYLPSVGFFLALVAGIILIKEKLAIQERAVEKILVPAMILVALALSVTAYARNMVWHDEVTLWEDVIKKSPNKARPYCNLGLALQKEDRLDEAIKAFLTAITLKPDSAENHYNLGVFYQKQSRLDEAIKAYETAIKYKPDYAEAYSNVGAAYANQGRLDEAIDAYKMAIKHGRIFAEAYKAHNNLAVALKTQGRLDEAVEACQTAIKLKPNYANAYFNLGLIYNTQGRLDEAIKAFLTAIKLKPDYTNAYCNLGVIYQTQGRLGEAIQSYQAAIKLEPDSADAHNNLGVVNFKQERFEEAYREFQVVLKIDPNHKDARTNLETLNRTMKNRQ